MAGNNFLSEALLKGRGGGRFQGVLSLQLPSCLAKYVHGT